MGVTVKPKSKAGLTKPKAKPRSYRAKPKSLAAKAATKADKALKLAKENRSKFETKIKYHQNSSAAFNFATGPPLHWEPTNMSIGTGEGQMSGNSCTLQSLRLRYRLQNTRINCPDVLRVMVVQYKSEVVTGVTPIYPLDTFNLPGNLHGATDYTLASLKRFTEDPNNSSQTLLYNVLYDKTHIIGNMQQDSRQSVVENDIVLKFKGKDAMYKRDVGTVTSHGKNSVHVFIFGGDTHRNGGVSAVDAKAFTQLRYVDA